MYVPKPGACQPIGLDPEVRFVWSLHDGRGIEHPHDEDGCPFDHDPELGAAAEEVAAETAGEPCPTCGGIHG
jgi:hypothetical protein